MPTKELTHAPHRWTGDTRGLLKLLDEGKRIVYEVAGTEWWPVYRPRHRYDPKPWVSGVYRFRSSELFARCRLGHCEQCRES